MGHYSDSYDDDEERFHLERLAKREERKKFLLDMIQYSIDVYGLVPTLTDIILDMEEGNKFYG